MRRASPLPQRNRLLGASRLGRGRAEDARYFSYLFSLPACLASQLSVEASIEVLCAWTEHVSHYLISPKIGMEELASTRIRSI